VHERRVERTRRGPWRGEQRDGAMKD
jgi:hypothetical protein